MSVRVKDNAWRKRRPWYLGSQGKIVVIVITVLTEMILKNNEGLPWWSRG